MSTVVDDLLNDFGSSGDEADEDNQNDGLIHNDEEETGDANRDAMDIDGDGSEKEASPDAQLDDIADAEATKAKVEKMQLGGVKDVRSVASLMQTLEPILEVSTLSPPRSLWTIVYICH